MAKSGITVKLEGFEELYKQIEKANGSMNKAAESCIKQSAQIVQSELKTQMQSAGVPSDLIGRMPSPTITAEGNTYTAHVGYEKGEYNEKKPSDGYKVVFLNYGTPHRRKHGKIVARGFIQKAKKKSAPKVKKAQKEVLEKIIGRLKT